MPSEVADALDGPWSLITHGGSFAAFASPHNDLVLKLFKTVDGQIRWFRQWGTDLGETRWAAFPGDERATASCYVGMLFDAVTFADEHLVAETGLRLVHLAPTRSRLPVVRLLDSDVALDDVPFVVQTKVEVLGQRLDRLMASGEVEAARAVVGRWLQLLATLWERGIAVHPNFDENYGFDRDDRLLVIDVGDIRWSRAAVEHDRARGSVVNSVAFSKLSQRHPELAEYLRTEYNRWIND